jgi:hypothetical protein
LQESNKSHFVSCEIKPVEVIDDWGLGFHLGMTISLIAGCDYSENRLEDLEKALSHLQHEIKLEKKLNNILGKK